MSAKGAGPLTKTLVVVDTSYLLELFAVPHRYKYSSTKASVTAVRKKFEDAIKAGAQLFVPLPVLFELGNHMADITDGNQRRQQAMQLQETVSQWLAGDGPITIVSAMDDSRTVQDFCSALAALTHRFKELAPSQHGLTDTAVVMEAERLHSKHPDTSLVKYQIHIWTRHRNLKAREPVTEANPFV